MIKLIIIGGEGNGGVIASVIESRNYLGEKIQIAGFLNDFDSGQIAGYPVLGPISSWRNFDNSFSFIWAIHTIGRNLLIEKAYVEASIPTERLVSVIHSDTFIAPTADLGCGVFIMKGAYVGPRAKIAESSMLMANVNFGHDSKCGKCCHFSVGAIVSSYVQIGDFADVTLGARVLEKVTVGDFAVVGSCSMATRNLGSGEIHIGIPSRFLKYIENWPK